MVFDYAPTAMPLMQPTALQQPVIDPRYGVNPYNVRPAPSAGSLADPNYMTANQANTLTSMGLPASAGMSEEEAARQSEVALAKLASVNPALAQQYAEQREDSGGGGFLGFLKDVGGIILSPVISVGGDILEILGRTSHIVPQWFNPEDKGNFITDIGQALSGEDKTNWNEVFQNTGFLENQGWLRATLGFGLDVLTDPLTYATLGAGAGLSTVQKAAFTAETVATKGVFAERLATVLGKSTDEASTLLTQAWSRASGQADNLRVVRQFADGGADELVAATGISAKAEVRSVLADAFEAGSRAYTKVYGRTWKNFINKGGEMTLSSGTVLKADEMKPMFEAIARGGNMTAYGDGAWAAAKAAAGSMGGLRFRYAVPFTQFRYISPMVPQSYRLGLASVGRFGAGYSGFKTVEKLGAEASNMFAQRGWKGVNELAEQGDEVARNLVDTVRASRAPFVRSAYYAASEMAGGLTAHITPGARLFRKGLGFYFARNGIKAADEMRRTLTNDLFYKIDPTATGSKTRSDLYRRYDAAYGRKAAKTRDDLRDARRYVDYFGQKYIPRGDAQVASGQLDEWFWKSRPDRVKAMSDMAEARRLSPQAAPTAEFVQHQAVLDDMKRVLKKVRGEDRAVLDDMVNTEAYGKTTLERHGVDVGDSTVNLDQARVLNVMDKHYLGERPEYLAKDFDVVLPQGVSAGQARQGGVTKDWSVDHEDLGVSGVRFDLTGKGAGKSGVKTQVRVRNIVDVDLDEYEAAVAATEEQIISGAATLPQILKAIDETFNDTGRKLAKGLHPALDNHILRLDWELTSRANMATQVLRKGPDAPEGVRFFRGGKADSMVIFDSNRVHVMTDDAATLVPQGGYFRRVLSPNLKAKLGGEAHKGQARIFGDPAEIELRFRRETRDMTLDEAEAHVRRTINNAGGRYEGITVGDTEDVFEWDVMKGHEEYIGYLGDSYFSVAMGRLTKRMLALGNLVPNEFGPVSAASRVMFQTPAGRLAQLMRADGKLQDMAIKLNQRQKDFEDREWKTITDQQERLALVLAYMDAGLTADHIPAHQLAYAMDGVVRSAARLQEVIGEEIPRLEAKSTQLYGELANTRLVHEQMRVTEWDDLDQFIEDHIHALTREREGVRGATPDVQISDAREWQRYSIKLRRAIAAGEAENVAPGVYRLDTDNLVADANLEDIEEVAGETYYAINPEGEVVSYRQVTNGKVVTETHPDWGRQGFAGKLIKAHWNKEGVTDFTDVKRLVGQQEFSRGGAELNKWAAKEILGEHGIHHSELIRDLLQRGELYMGKDGSILTKSGGIRKGGKRVRSITDIERDIMDVDEAIVELDDLRKPGSRARFTHEVSFEDYDTMAARRELEGGAPYRADEAPGAERVDYQADEEAVLNAKRWEPAEDGHTHDDAWLNASDDAPTHMSDFDHLVEEHGYTDEQAMGILDDVNLYKKDHAAMHGMSIQEAQLDAMRRGLEAEKVARPARTVASNPATEAEYRAAGGRVMLKIEDLLAYLRGRAKGADDVQIRNRGSIVSAKYPTPEDFEELVQSLRARGWDPDDPLTLAINKGSVGDVYKTGDADVVDGTHRLLAAQEAGLTEIPVDVRGALDFGNGYAWMRTHFPGAFPRDVQAEQVARGGLDDAAEAAAQDEFAARLFDAAGVTTPPTGGLTRAEARAQGRFEKAVNRVEAATGRTLEHEAKESVKRGKVLQRARQRVTEASTEFNRAKGTVEGLWAEMKPAVEFDLPPQGGKTMFREVQVPGLSGVYMHPYIAEEMETIFRGKPVGHLRSLYREFLLGPWKRWATYRNPGFHFRNAFGAWFNNVLGGVDAADHEFSRLVEMARGNKGNWNAEPVSAAHWKRYNLGNVAGLDGLQGQLTYGDISEMLADMGIGRANTTALAMTMGGEGLRDKARGRVGGAAAWLDSKLRNAGGLTEDFFRTAAWAGGMRHMSGDLYGARAFTMVRHGDYTDLTDTEDFIRDLVPFYKWMRTNVPYQFRMMAENPGLLLAITDKGQDFVYNVQGLDRATQEKSMPDWMKKSFNLPVPKGIPFIGGDGPQNYIMFDLPYSDLYNGLRDYLSSGLPVMRNIVESFGIEQSVYTGTPLGGHMVPLSGLWANPVVAPLIQAMPFAQKGLDGQTYIPDSIDNMLAAAPQYSRFRNWMLSDPDRVENRTATFTSALMGFGLRSEDATAAEQAFYYEELEPAMQRMRDMGYTFPTVEDLQQSGYFYDSYGSQLTSDQLWPEGVVAPPIATAA